MNEAIQFIHWLSGFIVLAESLNKLERTAPFAPGLCSHTRLVDLLKAIAWMLLALGAAGAVASPLLLAMGVSSADMPLLRLEHATLAETLVLLGFAVLIIRTRVKEG